MYVTPGIVVDGELVTTDLVEINLGIRILLGSSFYDDWEERRDRSSRRIRSATRSTRATRGTRRPRLAPQKRDFNEQVHLGHVAALARQAHGRSPGARHRRRPARALCGRRRSPGTVDIGYVKVDRQQREDRSAEDGASLPEIELEWSIPKWSNTLERNRARTYFQAYAAAAALLLRGAGARRSPRGAHQDVARRSRCRTRRSAAAFTRPCAASLSHHMVIRDGKIANYHPYPPTPWNASPRDSFGTPGPYEDAVQNTPHLRGERPRQLQGHRHHAHGAELRSRACRAACTCTWAAAKSQGPSLADLRSADQMTERTPFDASMTRLEELLGEVERCAPPDTLGVVRELVSTLLEVHRPGLEELLQAAMDSHTDEGAMAVCETPSVASLLLMHNLHPKSLEARVAGAFTEAHDAAGHAARAVVTRIDGASVAVRIDSEKPAAAALLRRTVERIVEERAPDAVLGIDGGASMPEPGLIPVSRLFARGGTAAE